MALVHNLGTFQHIRRKSSSEIVYGIEDFPVVRPLGEGSYSSVYLSSHKRLSNLPNQSEELVVVKKVNKSKSQAHFLHSEKEAGRRLHFPHIAEVRANFEDTEHFYFVMNYINGIDLYKFFEQRAFEPFSELRARRLFKQLVDALNYAQKRNVSHRDLKLENIMIINPTKNETDFSEEKLVIIDWGLCGVDEESKLSNRWVGSPDYVCPEILLHQAYQPEKADVWSLGVLLFIFLTGKLPYQKKKRFSMLRVGQHPHVSFPESSKLSGDAKDLIDRTLEFHPDNRIDLVGILNHPWLKSDL